MKLLIFLYAQGALRLTFLAEKANLTPTFYRNGDFMLV
ncbi:hypothetical protein VIC_003235 [Vibrio coralliilyticus ATCC BAA-450]|nr:hypothetical protein VIC_003235 [Vibrio coralliilyticus ATCC BAA-450]ERB66354.1 hypothetical protein N779_05670 [Vibrio coralliilyticus OCN008]